MKGSAARASHTGATSITASLDVEPARRKAKSMNSKNGSRKTKKGFFRKRDKSPAGPPSLPPPMLPDETARIAAATRMTRRASLTGANVNCIKKDKKEQLLSADSPYASPAALQRAKMQAAQNIQYLAVNVASGPKGRATGAGRASSAAGSRGFLTGGVAQSNAEVDAFIARDLKRSASPGPSPAVSKRRKSIEDTHMTDVNADTGTASSSSAAAAAPPGSGAFEAVMEVPPVDIEGAAQTSIYAAMS
jgi:hypothetical protein